MRALESSSRRKGQAGFFLIEAMVALLIFALGILGLVAMGGTAVASQSDAQYRTEATAIADAIAGEIALNVARQAAPPLTSAQVKAASLLTFAHHPAGGNCVFGGAPTANASVQRRLPTRRQRVGAQGLPGATTVNQQVLINGAGTFNRVEITLCWRTANDNAMRRHTLVTYVN